MIWRGEGWCFRRADRGGEHWEEIPPRPSVVPITSPPAALQKVTGGIQPPHTSSFRYLFM